MPPSRPLKPIATPRRHRCALAFYLFLFAAVSFLAITARAQQTPARGEDEEKQEESVQAKPSGPAKSIIRGRVIYDDTNRPVRRANVMLMHADGTAGAQTSAMTDARGEFRFQNVAAGSYFIAVNAPGVITPFSQIDIGEVVNEKATLLAIRKEFDEISVNGTNSVEVQIRAKRGGAITGRITYGDGDPAPNVPVTILRKKDNRFIRFITNFSPSGLMGFRTDDRGVYRIAGLPPGEYIVGAAESYGREDSRDDYSEYSLLGGSALSTTYYQNETNPRQATPIKVEASQETTEINITLVERPTYTISGTVVARQGRSPVANARISIQPKTDESQATLLDSSQGVSTDAAGNWTIPSVPDGTYILTVDPNNDLEMTEDIEPVSVDNETQVVKSRQRPTRPPKPALTKRQQEVTVSGADLSGVVIELSEGGRIQGRVIVEGSKKLLQNGAAIYLTGTDGKKPFEKSGYVSDKGAFVIDAVPPGEFTLYLPELEGDYYIKSMTAGSTDLLREPLKIGQATSIDNVVITVSSEVATLTGRVLSSEDGKPVRGAGVLVVPIDQSRWRFSNTFLFGSTDGAGSFKVTGAPGTYLVIPLAAGEQLRGLNEAFIRQRATGAKQVSLQPNGHETIELIAPPQPQQ